MNQPASRRFLTVLMVVATALLALLIAPFAAPFFIAAVLAGVLDSSQRRLSKALGRRPRLAAGLLTAAIVLVVVVPLTVMSVLVIEQASDLRKWVSRTASEKGIEGLVAPMPDRLRAPARMVLKLIPPGVLISKPLDEAAEPALQDGSAAVAPAGEVQSTQPGETPAKEESEGSRPDIPKKTPDLKAAADAAGFVTRVLASFVHVLVAVGMFIIALFFLLAEGERLVNYLIGLMPMPEKTSREMLSAFREITWAVLLSTIVTAVVQTAVAFIGYLIAGVPGLALMLFVTFVMAFVPAIGATGVVMATGIVLCLAGRVGMGIFLAAWGMLAVGLIDNLVKPMMVGGRTTLPSGVVFFAMICGLATLGPMGLVAGPLIVAFFTAVARIMRNQRVP